MIIHIGEYFASKHPTKIYTLVGSCVAVCLFDPVHRIGGMNHIFLPGKADLNRFDAPARYGINAMELLINKIMRLGGNRKYFIAKAFGGAHMLPVINKNNSIGSKNVDFVLEFMQSESIKIVSSDLGGNETRKIFFHTDTGDVFLKRIKPSFTLNIIEREKQMLKRMKQQLDKPTKITLFNINNGYQ